MKTAILIPTRHGSTRFPGKPLVDLNGKTLIRRVVESCLKVPDAHVYALTDHKDIEKEARDAGARTILSDREFDNGTHRCSAFLNQKALSQQYDFFINVQGDMVDIEPEHIQTLLQLRSNIDRDVYSLRTDLNSFERSDKNAVKVVTNAIGDAIWFARGFTGYGYKHMGIYGYTRQALKDYPRLGKTLEETEEGLEQLRYLKYGYRMGLAKVNFSGIEINTPEDAERWRKSHPYRATETVSINRDMLPTFEGDFSVSFAMVENRQELDYDKIWKSLGHNKSYRSE